VVGDPVVAGYSAQRKGTVREALLYDMCQNAPPPLPARVITRDILDCGGIVEENRVPCETVAEPDEGRHAEKIYVCFGDGRRVCPVELVHDANRRMCGWAEPLRPHSEDHTGDLAAFGGSTFPYFFRTFRLDPDDDGSPVLQVVQTRRVRKRPDEMARAPGVDNQITRSRLMSRTRGTHSTEMVQT
jgi:hypothetical protein